ncbi:unnamed protein product [Arabidopsis thaliana]|uniref:(thale cress) hypothetical protein n=1 Tax=Arabidopsis thaliana TaxID=3702 RepID=A0A7G2EGL6_ARATH|nr:unnamed protein product [Arabidopsis thaliana]
MMPEQTYMYAYVTLPHHDQRERYTQKCYRDGRRIVLASYDLMGSERFSFKEKLRKSMKGMNESAERWVSEVRQGSIFIESTAGATFNGDLTAAWSLDQMPEEDP